MVFIYKRAFILLLLVLKIGEVTASTTGNTSFSRTKVWFSAEEPSVLTAKEGAGEGGVQKEAGAQERAERAVAQKKKKDKAGLFSLNVERWDLENGLRVLFHPRPRIPKVYFQTLFKVGSQDEKEGETGIAHTLEHLLFKGSRYYSGKTFNREIEDRGIFTNAATSYDYTLYYYDLFPEHLKWLIKVEADRMGWPLLRRKDLQAEKPIILEERRMRLTNSPWGTLYTKSLELLFATHTYGRPIIGYVQDIEGYTRKQVRDFYHKYYIPSNAVLVIAGNFNTAEVKKWLKKYYGKIPSGTLEKSLSPQEPKQTKSRTQNIQKEVQGTYLSLTFQGTPQSNPDSYALDVLGAILGGGSSSRLYRRLAHFNRVSTSIYSGHSSMNTGGFFYIESQLYPNKAPQKAIYLIQDELNKLRTQQVRSWEIQKVKAQIMKSKVDSLTTLKGRSRLLAYYELFLGNYERAFDELKNYEQVTARQILEVANKYLKPNQANITTLSPKKSSKK